MNTFQHDGTSELIVQTPYGRGLVIKVRELDDDFSTNKESIKEIRLLDWEQGVNNRSSKHGRSKGPLLYTTIDYNSVTPKKGDEVITPYGRGLIEETVRVGIDKKKIANEMNDSHEKRNQGSMKYRISLTSWRLAGRSRVKCYLFSSQIKVVRKKTVKEMNAFERIDFAMAQKSLASRLFVEKKYGDALTLYAYAVDAVRYIQHSQNTSNEYRADLLVVIITCSNNAATCCIQLLKLEEAKRYAKNALILLNALYNKRGMKIHGVMTKDKQLSDAKIFGEWRGKSCLIIARSESNKDMLDEAMASLKKGKDYISEYLNDESSPPEQKKRLRDLLKEVVKLKNILVEKKRIIHKKEKASAQAMFSDAERPSSKARKEKGSTYASSSSSNLEKAQQDVADEKANHVEKQEEKMTKEASFPSLETKQVSFSKDLMEKKHLINLENEEEEEIEPWYEQHKEALLILAIGGLACLSKVLAFQRKQSL